MSARNRKRAIATIAILVVVALGLVLVGSIGFATRDLTIGLGVALGALAAWTIVRLRGRGDGSPSEGD